VVEGSQVPEEIPETIEWRFDEPQLDWKAFDHFSPHNPLPLLARTEDALRVTLAEANKDPRGDWLHGDIYVEVPQLTRSDWSHVLVRARAAEDIIEFWFIPKDLGLRGQVAPVVNDGTVQTYRFRADWPPPVSGESEGPWGELGIVINAGKPSSFDILSVSIIPKAALYAEAPFGIRTEVRSDGHRRALYTHVPGRLEYRVRVPPAARLDVGLGALRADVPVGFRITATSPGDEAQTLLEETYADRERWAQRSVDLSALAGQTVTLALETEAEQSGDVAFWAAPTLSSAGAQEMPNVIFYVIDGGAADFMSVYGYNRRTTPNLERLAAEGAVFEHAYSNSSHTAASTPSFMTSLQNSVLGNTLGNRFDPLPEEAVTMALHFHRARYLTAVFTSNANASLDRGVDVMRDVGVERDFISSRELHRDFWSWRDAYPGEPYWVHFQTTDVHEYEGGQPEPVAPFSGMFVSAAKRQRYYENWELIREWQRQNPASGGWRGGAFAGTRIDRVGFFETMLGLYDESMAHQDHQIGRLVERLKAAGEWENTLLIVAADHSVEEALWDLAPLLQEELPPPWGPLFRSTVTRVPLIFVWPGHIVAGRRFTDAVSMIDVLPTVLDLVDLPKPEVMQGRSLAPLPRNTGELEPRPVILDEFSRDRATGQLQGQIEIVDGRWGASLWIGPEPQEKEAARPTPLLLYDLWNDPWCLEPLNDEYPDLVEKYTAFLEKQWEAHQALAQHFTPGGEVELTPEQLETLRALGYIQ
jgi:arylsulfatase A-like enzyme